MGVPCQLKRCVTLLTAVFTLTGWYSPARAQEAPASVIAGSATPIRVYPNPWRSDRHIAFPIKFDNLLENSDVIIYTASGHQVRRVTAVGSIASWDLANDSGNRVASGIYLYLAKDASGQQSHGKFAVIH